MRSIAYNVYACDGWPREERDPGTSKPIPLQMAGALAGLSPDILTFSEAPDEPTVSEIARRLGLEPVFFPSGQKWPGALLTRFPVRDIRRGREFSNDPELFTRHAGRALLETPMGEIAVYSAHLHVKDAGTRHREIALLLDSIQNDCGAGRSVLLQGDLNHQPTWPEYGLWKSAGLTDTWIAAGEGSGETIKSNDPERRIDYIWCRGPLAGEIRQARVVNEAPFGTGGNNPAPLTFLSDHLPVLADFK